MKASLLIAAVLAALPSAARADGTARDHFDKGSALYDIGKYVDAAREYEEAYTLKPDPALLFNIGQAYRQAGNVAAALRGYRSYLRRLPNASNRAEVERHIAALQKLADEQQRVATSPSTTTIQPSDKPAPPSHEPAAAHEPAPHEPANAPSPEPSASSPASAPAPSVVVAPPPAAAPPPPTPVYRRWWLWTTVVAVVAVGAGVGLGLGLTQPRDAPAPSGAILLSFH